MHTVWKMDMSHVTFLWVFSNFHLSVFKLDFQKAWKKQLQWKTQKLFFLTSEIQVAERHWRFLYSQTFCLIWPEELGPIGLFKKKHAGLRHTSSTFLTKKLCQFFMYCVWVWQTYPRCHLVDRESPWFGRCCSELPDWLKHPLQTHQRMIPGEKRE